MPPPGPTPAWLAAVITRCDDPVAGRHVWEHNNLAQKNLIVVDLVPGEYVIVPVVLTGRFGGEQLLQRRSGTQLPVPSCITAPLSCS